MWASIIGRSFDGGTARRRFRTRRGGQADELFLSKNTHSREQWPRYGGNSCVAVARGFIYKTMYVRRPRSTLVPIRLTPCTGERGSG